MLNIKNFFIRKQNLYIEDLKQSIEVNNYYIKAIELRKLLNMNMAQLDSIITTNNIPISKHRKGIGLNETYYIFPIEQIIANYFLIREHK